MTDALWLAWRYLAHHRWTTTVLVLAIALIVYIPAGLRVLVRQSQAQLTARAEATPLLVGARGSPLELALRSLYFSGREATTLPFSEVGAIADTGLATPIPLDVRFRSMDDPIVGTSLDYFEFRGLAVAAGTPMTRLGDCVVGAGVAHRRAIGPGDFVVSSPESVFDLAGVYPLRMRVAGVLAFSDGPDDDAIFVDVRTAWIIEGRAHGHADLADPAAAAGVLRREDDRIVANASVVEYNEVTAENLASFHFHGAVEGFPVTAIIAVPPDHKSSALLQGRYQADDAPHQVVRPAEVVDDLLATILTVESYVVAAVIAVGAATVATAALVFALSIRLRRRQIETMARIGAARGRIAMVYGGEIVLVLGAAVVLAAALTAATAQYGAPLIRSILLS
ncbi:MAG: ABC transporter permease [Planctomycetota bacterium]|jgi:putative ABC transport system permease protein